MDHQAPVIFKQNNITDAITMIRMQFTKTTSFFCIIKNLCNDDTLRQKEEEFPFYTKKRQRHFYSNLVVLTLHLQPPHKEKTKLLRTTIFSNRIIIFVLVLVYCTSHSNANTTHCVSYEHPIRIHIFK